MPLAIGTKAPDFTLSTKTADGPNRSGLARSLGKGNTLLLFFPMALRAHAPRKCVRSVRA